MDGPRALPPRTVEVLQRLEQQYSPTVPDELVQHFQRRSGDDSADPQLVRFIGLAGERFLASILSDAMQLSRRRATMSHQVRRQLGYSGAGKRDDKRHVLLTEDVAEALKDIGVNVRGSAYYVSNPR